MRRPVVLLDWRAFTLRAALAFLVALTIAILLIAFSLPADAQRNNVRYVHEFPGVNVGTKATAAQNACASTLPCVIIFDPVLEDFSEGTLPARCSNCLWVDYRTAGEVSFSEIAGAKIACGYPGADLGAKIVAAIADAARGVVDARCAEGGTITAQIEGKSNIHLIFGAGTYTNMGTSGGRFINIAAGVSNFKVSGQGVGATVLRNNSSGTQFGAVIQDQGTDNVIADLTLDGNGNTTATLITQQSTRFKIKGSVKLKHDTTHNPVTNYAWHVRGGEYYEVDALEIHGGSQGGIQLHADDTYGNCRFGRVNSVYVHDVPWNGIDSHALGTGKLIEGWTWSNIVIKDTGTQNAGTDDEFGLYLFGSDTGENRGNSFSNVYINGAKMHGLRLKGRVYGNSFHGVNSSNNGTGVGNGSAISIANGAGADAPLNNYIQGQVREAGAAGNHALVTESNAARNIYALEIGSSTISLGSTNDVHQFITPDNGVSSVSAIRFDQQSRSSAPGTPSLSNISGVGVWLNSGGAIVLSPATSVRPETTGTDFGTTSERWDVFADLISFSATTFASLGAPANGTVKFCSDCTIANPCAGAGSGAIAKRLNGAWVCN